MVNVRVGVSERDQDKHAWGMNMTMKNTQQKT